MKNTKIRLTHLATTKAEIYEALRDWKPGDLPIIILCTERRMVSHLGFGLRSAWPDRRFFWASGENSRYFETMQLFDGTWRDDEGRNVFDVACAIMLSPVSPSGVSFDDPVGPVFMLHRKRDMPIESCIQLFRRFRKPERIVFGIAEWHPTYLAYDDKTLDAICAGRNDATWRLLMPLLPTMKGKTELVHADPGFARSFRSQARKVGQSYEDPIGRTLELAEEYRLNLIDELIIPKRSSAPEFRALQNIIENGKRRRQKLEAEEIVRAAPVDDPEAKRIKEQPRYYRNERQKKQRYDLEQFFGETISPELVYEDNWGALRRKVLSFVDFEMVNEDQDIEAHEDSPFAWMCWEENKGKQPVSRTHRYQKATLLLTAFQYMTGRSPCAEDYEDPQWRTADSIGEGILAFMDAWGDAFLMNWPRNRLTDPDKAVRFANNLLRTLGFEIESRRRQDRARGVTWREYRWSCARIRDFSRHQKKQRIERFEEAKKKKRWDKFLNDVRKM